jgi:hypothetical protein
MFESLEEHHDIEMMVKRCWKIRETRHLEKAGARNNFFRRVDPRTRYVNSHEFGWF